MQTTSKSTIRWFLGASAAYVALCLVLKLCIPPPIFCNAEDLFVASIFGLIGFLCILIGAAGYLSLSRDEHPISFWVMVSTAWLFSLLLALCGVGVFRPACIG